VLAFGKRGPVLRRVILHDDHLEARHLLRRADIVPWPRVGGVRIAPFDPRGPGPWENDPWRGYAVEVRLDGVWTRLGELTAEAVQPNRINRLTDDPSSFIREGYATVHGYWERGGGRADPDDT
jgi:hypothetical protein